jgi:hypothetical protein
MDTYRDTMKQLAIIEAVEQFSGVDGQDDFYLENQDFRMSKVNFEIFINSLHSHKALRFIAFVNYPIEVPEGMSDEDALNLTDPNDENISVQFNDINVGELNKVKDKIEKYSEYLATTGQQEKILDIDCEYNGLSYHFDSAVKYNNERIKMEPRHKTLIGVFIRAKGGNVNFSDIRDKMIGRGGQTYSNTRIAQEVSDLRKKLTEVFSRNVIQEDGQGLWYLDINQS